MPSSLEKWNKFKVELPHQSGEMAKRNWGHPWHSMCSYQGKLKPAIAHSLLDIVNVSKGGAVLDPFSGVGTVPFEARLRGCVAFGFDISPAAIQISRAKLEKVDWQKVDSLMGDLAGRVSVAKGYSVSEFDNIRFNGPLASYFHPITLQEILASREFLLSRTEEDAAASIISASMMHILHGNRPYALSRRSHPITPFSPTGDFEYRGVMDRLQAKLNRLRLSSENIPDVSGKSFDQDATSEWPEEVCDLDAVVTSPPFFDSTRFYSANWMRLWFSGWVGADFNLMPELFVDEKQKKTFEIYDPIFKQARDRLRSNGVFIVHVGKSRKCDMSEKIAEIGSRHLQLADIFSESVEHCESHGIRDKGTVTHHQYLIFEKSK